MILDRFQDLGTETSTVFDFGFGAMDRAGDWARKLQLRNILLVADPSLSEVGRTQRLLSNLHAAGCEVTVFSDVRENPTTDDIRRCVETAQNCNPDGIFALGGGSTIDTAKACNLILTQGGRIADYRGRGAVSTPMLTAVVIPTTSGTGSESQSAMLISDESTHEKLVCLDPQLTPAVAILDPELTRTVPSCVREATSLDTLVHAVEALVTRSRNEISHRYSSEALLLSLHCFERVLDDPADDEARAGMMLASAYAGLAIEHSMLGAAHSLANPLTQYHGLTHGYAVAVSLPLVLRFNLQDDAVQSIYGAIGRQSGCCAPGAADPQAAGALVEVLERLVDRTSARKQLRARIGLQAPSFEVLAAAAEGQWTAQFNPIAVPSEQWNSWYAELVPSNAET
jgi:alcohol dehydrogenase